MVKGASSWQFAKPCQLNARAGAASALTRVAARPELVERFAESPFGPRIASTFVTKPGSPIRVLRVIARLNVGGPALHVSYLTEGLDRLGYETMLVAGRVGPDEGSMEYVPEQLGLHPVYVPELQREVSPIVDVVAVRRLRALIRSSAPTSSTRTRRRQGRSAGWRRSARATRGRR